MNIFRSVVASFLIFIFIFASLAAIVSWGLFATISYDNFAEAIVASRASGSAQDILAEPLAQALGADKLGIKPDALKPIIATALPPAEADNILKDLSRETMDYISGKSNTVAPIDVAPVLTRAQTAIKEQYPGRTGTLMADKLEALAKAQNLDKGLSVFSADSLISARRSYSVLRTVAFGALLALVLIFGLIFAVAPRGLRGRLQYGGVAALMAASFCVLAVAIGFFVPGLIASFAGASLPEFARPILNNLASPLAAAVLKNMLSVLLPIALVGAVCLFLNAYLRKKQKPAERKS